jgi:hypothetical protein
MNICKSWRYPRFHHGPCLQSSSRRQATDHPIPVDSLRISEHHYSSSRVGSCDDRASLARVSCDSDRVWTNPTLASSFTSAAATLACMRPSSASLRVKRAISESYSSHSGICRARESFGSFCVCSSASYFLSKGRHEPSADSGTGRLSWPGGAVLCYLRKIVINQKEQRHLFVTYTMFHTKASTIVSHLCFRFVIGLTHNQSS